MLRALCSVLLVPFRLNHSLPAKRVTSMKQTFFLFALLIFTARAVTDLPAGSAKRSLTYDGATAELTFTAAFVDQKDERKPIVLVISDQKLQVEKWESEFDVMLAPFEMERSCFLSRQGRKSLRPDLISCMRRLRQQLGLLATNPNKQTNCRLRK